MMDRLECLAGLLLLEGNEQELVDFDMTDDMLPKVEQRLFPRVDMGWIEYDVVVVFDGMIVWAVSKN